MRPLIINLQEPMARCCVCGRWDLSKWGVPISMETCLIVANDFDGDWAGKPACERCWKAHSNGALVGHEPRY